MKNFFHNARDRERALMRGGACEFLPLHEEWAVAAETLFQSSAGVASFLQCNMEARFRGLVGMSFSRSDVEDFGDGVALVLGQ